MLSFNTPEYVVRKIVSAISSAIEKSEFLNSSNSIGIADHRRHPSHRLAAEKAIARLVPAVPQETTASLG